jgi:hypothetical protein
MIILILVLLIPAAYYVGRFTQWRNDLDRFTGWRRDRLCNAFVPTSSP